MGPRTHAHKCTHSHTHTTHHRHTHTHRSAAVYSCQRCPLKESTFNNDCYYRVNVYPSLSPSPSTCLLLFSVEPVCQPGECCLVLKAGRGVGWGGSACDSPHSPGRARPGPRPRLLLAGPQPGLHGREAGPVPPRHVALPRWKERGGPGMGTMESRSQRGNREEGSCLISLQGDWHPLP